MSVVAEIGGKKLEYIKEFCPDLDIVGINSYGGGPSIGEQGQLEEAQKLGLTVTVGIWLAQRRPAFGSDFDDGPPDSFHMSLCLCKLGALWRPCWCCPWARWRSRRRCR